MRVLICVVLLVAVLTAEGAPMTPTQGKKGTAAPAANKGKKETKTRSGGPALYAYLKDSKIKQEKADIELAKVLSCMRNNEFIPSLSSECQKLQGAQEKIMKIIKFQYPKEKLQLWGDSDPKLARKSGAPAPSAPAAVAAAPPPTKNKNVGKLSFMELRSRLRNPVVKSTASLWDRALVPFFIDVSIPATNVTDPYDTRIRIKASIEAWQTTTCLRFKEVASDVVGDRLKFVKTDDRRCASDLGKGLTDMILCMPKPGAAWDKGCPTGTIVHELGHSVGVKHSMGRQNRDDWLDYDPTAPHSVGAHNYAIADPATFKDSTVNIGVDDNGKIDDYYGSTMMYPSKPQSQKPITAQPKDAARRITLARASTRYNLVGKEDAAPEVVAAVKAEAKRRSEMYQRNDAVNAYDAAVVNELYGCFSITIAYKKVAADKTATLRLNKDWQWQELTEYIKTALVADGALAPTDNFKLQKAGVDIAAPAPVTTAVNGLIANGDTVTVVKI